MIIKINGKEEEIKNGVTLLNIIEEKGLIPERIVVECNKKIISKNMLADVVVAEKDAIEILSFVGGG